MALLVLGREARHNVVDVGGRAVHLLDERRHGLLVRGLPHELLTGGRLDLLATPRRRVGCIEQDRAIRLGDRHHLVGTSDVLGELRDDLLVEFGHRDVGDGDLAHRCDGCSKFVAADAVVAEQERDELEQVAVRGRRHRVERLLRQLAARDQPLADRVALVDGLTRGRRLGERGGSAAAGWCHVFWSGLAECHRDALDLRTGRRPAARTGWVRSAVTSGRRLRRRAPMRQRDARTDSDPGRSALVRPLRAVRAARRSRRPGAVPASLN